MQTVSGTTHDLRPAFVWAMVRLLLASVREGVGPSHHTGEEDAAMNTPNEIASFMSHWNREAQRTLQTARSAPGRPVRFPS